MRTSLTFGLALALAAGALSGCGTQTRLTAPDPTPGAGSADEAAVSSVLTQTPTMVEDGAYDDPSQVELDSSSEAAAAIHPLRYWREITHVDRHVSIDFADPDATGRPTTARVTVRKFMTGRFNILIGLTDPPTPDQTDVLHKPLGDLWERHLLLKRVNAEPTDTHRGWRLAATSDVQVTSYDPRSDSARPAFGQTRIVSLRIQATGLDTTVVDPLALFRLRRVLAFNPDEPVTLTVTTRAADDVVVLMRRGLKLRFHANGDGTFTGTWKAPQVSGLGHVGVNAMAHGTLFDDEAPYDSQAWILPYLVRPTMLAEYMP